MTAPLPPKSLAAACALAMLATGCGQVERDRDTLRDYRWEVATASDLSGRPLQRLQGRGPQAVRLSVDAQRLHIAAGCNRFQVRYRLQAGRIVPEGELEQTEMACALADAPAIEQAVAQHLRGPIAYSVHGQGAELRLGLLAHDGTRLSLHPVEAGYARGTPRIVYLEEDGRACPPPNAAPCLWVRERRVEARGQWGRPAGDWQALPGAVHDYRPEAGQRRLLRVKRYPAAAGVAPVHVLAAVEAQAPATAASP